MIEFDQTFFYHMNRVELFFFGLKNEIQDDMNQNIRTIISWSQHGQSLQIVDQIDFKNCSYRYVNTLRKFFFKSRYNEILGSKSHQDNQFKKALKQKTD